MTKKARRRARAAEIRALYLDLAKQWALAHTRGRRPLAEIRLLMENMLRAKGRLAREELILQHRLDSRLTLDVAMAEVDQYHKDIAEELRHNGLPLLHPVTEEGYRLADTVNPKDAKAVARCVSGLGRGNSVYGWRVAHLQDDPCYIAYVNFRTHSGAAAVDRGIAMQAAGNAAGILPPVTVNDPPHKLL